ncbi:ABC transporter substrate-binding protein [Nonomuraea sp. NPDC050643]|uniref:ABC transporter substrate-binding protein n=1 Tax=Nonomuraea sp. NPDC050643 TaxID=3155660 RepID=UPI0033E0B815
MTAAQDTAVLGLGSEPDSLNPVLGYAVDGGSLIFDGLVRRTPDLKLQPALAESLPEVTRKEVTFTLRQGVTFHDGRALTAADVAYTYGQVLKPANNSPVRGDYAAIDKVEAYRERTGAGVLAVSHDAELLERWTDGNVHAWHPPTRSPAGGS